MANMLATGLAWLGTQLTTHASESLVLRRGAFTTDLSGVLGRSELLAEDVDGQAQVLHSDRDFLVMVVDYKVNDVAVEPAAGDQLDWTKGGVTKTFELQPRAGFQAWTFSDPLETMYRLHTKLVAVV